MPREYLCWSVFLTLFCCCVVTYAGGYCAYRYKQRRVWILGGQVFAFMGVLYTMLSIVQSPSIVDGAAKHSGRAQLLFLAAFTYLPGAYFCLPIALAWVLNCMPWNRPKRAACIAIVTSILSTGNIYAVFAPPMENREEGRNLNKMFIGGLMVCVVGTCVAVMLLTIILYRVNKWLNRLQGPHPQPSRQVWRLALDAEFYNLDHTFRFLN
ncbi:hypothetical protein F4804DRAFT_320912 [Jackrogersella minutella]|nr:hypothetical protein F4804DRAFT_320912 [Jackrogersella minutella]